MWLKNCITISFRCVGIDKIPDLKKESVCSIQFCCNISKMMFQVQIFIRSNAKIFNRICGIESFSTKFNLNFFFSLWCLKITNSAFCTFGEFVLAFNQSVMFVISRFTYLFNLVVDLLKWIRFVSSVKWWTLENFIAWFKSLIYVKDKTGPRTKSWGIPNKTEARFKSWLFIETNCFL